MKLQQDSLNARQDRQRHRETLHGTPIESSLASPLRSQGFKRRKREVEDIISFFFFFRILAPAFLVRYNLKGPEKGRVLNGALDATVY